MYIKKLVGKKCYLSPIDIDDAEKYAVWLNDQEVSDYLQTATSVIPVEGEKELLKTISKEHNYAIVDIQNNQLIGNTGFVHIDYINKTAEAGIFIGDKSYWSKGYGQEALALLIDYAYKKLNLHSIVLRVFSFNKRAVACYEKIGFKYVGEIRQALIRNLQHHNIILMDILPDEFYTKNSTYKKSI